MIMMMKNKQTNKQIKNGMFIAINICFLAAGVFLVFRGGVLKLRR